MANYGELYLYIKDKFRTELDSRLHYHNWEHTQNVIDAVEKIAPEEGIKDTLLLKTAALLHDTGFLSNPVPDGHEQRSIDLAKKTLPNYNFTEEQIKAICQIIGATKLPQTPLNLEQKIICDADLHYLGTDSYTEKSHSLIQENRAMGNKIDDDQWKEQQIVFLERHHFFTEFARNTLEPKKRKTLENLKTEHKTADTNGIIRDVLLTLAGVFFAGIALKGFLVPNHFFDGGVTGISLLIHELYGINLGVILVLLNLPLVVLSYYTVGKKFAIRTFLAVLALSICLTYLPIFDITHDKLLISIFGGVFLGIGVGLVMRTGAALDGIEVLALYTLKRTSFTITEIILGINVVIFSIAALKFGPETALYSVLTYFTATKTIDYVVEGIQAYTGVTIISSKSEDIKYELVNTMKKGITVYKGERGYLPGSYDVHADTDIIFTVVSRLELRKLKNTIHEIDPNAFVFANTIKEALGGVTTRKQSH